MFDNYQLMLTLGLIVMFGMLTYSFARCISQPFVKSKWATNTEISLGETLQRNILC